MTLAREVLDLIEMDWGKTPTRTEKDFAKFLLDSYFKEFGKPTESEIERLSIEYGLNSYRVKFIVKNAWLDFKV